MGVLIQDTARNNLVTWSVHAVAGGYGVGTMLSPFASPFEANGFKRSALATSEAIREAGGEFWLDPMTYALDMPRAGDFRHYAEWDFWSTTRGDLTSRAAMREHVQRVFRAQTALDSPALAPTVLVSYPDTPRSQTALELAQVAMEADTGAWLSVAGDQEFWSAGAELDAHVGALDQLEPAGWMFIVTRGDNSMPPSASTNEIFGLMRATYALSQDRPVRVAYGDLAAVPALAAGAEVVGTGWDIRQRICAYQDFEERPADTQDGGGWYQRPTLAGLLGGLTSREYEVLVSEEAALAARLTPAAIGPRPEQAFRHHATVLTNVATALSSLSGRARAEAMRQMYLDAEGEWPAVQAITGTRLGPSRWIAPFKAGLEVFMTSEGWL
ncbi:hypothetical protein [Nocardioides caricicola]|uniref:Uncharacterized protein n=1 Tax=Nocardioides caricicola TaxID=634770 RepID=A0ABW0N4K7_9ACTN